MLESVMVKSAIVRLAEFLFRSLVVAAALYAVTTLAVMIAALVSLLTGWYPFVIESGPLGFLGYTVHIGNGTNFDISVEPNLVGFFVLVAAAGLLIRVGSAVRALGNSLRSWADLS